MGTIRNINRQIRIDNVVLTAIRITGFTSWLGFRHLRQGKLIEVMYWRRIFYVGVINPDSDGGSLSSVYRTDGERLVLTRRHSGSDARFRLPVHSGSRAIRKLSLSWR